MYEFETLLNAYMLFNIFKEVLLVLHYDISIRLMGEVGNVAYIPPPGLHFIISLDKFWPYP